MGARAGADDVAAAVFIVLLVVAPLAMATAFVVRAVQQWHDRAPGLDRLDPPEQRAAVAQFVAVALFVCGAVAVVLGQAAEVLALLLTGVGLVAVGFVGKALERSVRRRSRPLWAIPPHLRAPGTPRRAAVAPAEVPASEDVDAVWRRHPEAAAAVAGAVERARGLRGTAMLEARGAEHRWCAVSSAADGEFKANVAEPRRGWRVWDASGQRRLQRQGFVHDFDVWTRRLGARTPAATCAAVLATALEEGLGWSGEPLAERLTFPGVAGGGAPPPGAPHEAHAEAALRSLVAARRGRSRFESGVPSLLWGVVAFVPERDVLLVERDEPGRPGEGSDAWEVPATDDGAAEAARELVRRTVADVPSVRDEPLFVELIDVDPRTERP